MGRLTTRTKAPLLQRYRKPPRTHLGYLPFFPLAWAANAVHEGVATETWWAQLPFFWIAGLFLAYAIGIWVSDLRDAKSWIRQDWRQWRKVFDVVAFGAQHHENDPEHIGIWVLMKFNRDVYNTRLIVRLTILLPVGDPIRKVIHEEVLTSALRESERRLRIGSFAINGPAKDHASVKPARHSVWGNVIGGESIAEGQTPIIGLSENIVELSVGPQTYRLFVKTLDPSRKASSMVYLMSEDEVPNL